LCPFILDRARLLAFVRDVENNEGDAEGKGVESPETLAGELEAEVKPEINQGSGAAVNGALFGGIAKGTELPTKRTYKANPLAQAAAERFLSGKMTQSKCGPVTEADKRLIQRITGEPAETFQARITSKLESMADETAELIFEKLRNDQFRPDTLPSLLAITIDKLQVLNGRASAIGSVNIQINAAFAAKDAPRSDVLSALNGLRSGKPVEPVQAEAIAV